MTTESFRVDRPPGWYVVTDQGVVLSARFDTEASAAVERDHVVGRLRHELVREGRPARFVVERLAAVRVDFGVLIAPWGGFASMARPMNSGPAT